MKMVLIRSGTVYTMCDNEAISADILISDGKIVRISRGIKPSCGKNVIILSKCVDNGTQIVVILI